MTWKSINFLCNYIFREENLSVGFLPKKLNKWHFVGEKLYTWSVHLICINSYGTDVNQ